MLFCSTRYALFFALVFAAYWFFPWHRLHLSLPFGRRAGGGGRYELTGDEGRVWLLLAASFFFYAYWSRKFAIIVFASTFIDYWLARGIEATAIPRRRKLLLALNLTLNLGLLCYFKYANFFLDSLQHTLNALGLHAAWRPLQIILPIGVSFYTFEAINYMVDVYRRHVPAERNLAHFLLFITFFPHLLAGPIVRARDFLPQIRLRKRWDWARLQLGVQLFLFGLLKKLVVADRMALFVEPVFKNPEQYGTWAVWLSTLAFALQIYCDFSGYTDMALGSAHMLGYKLARNFDMPYLSANVTEFWRRWHISLSSWLRDYLFIPLGGSRGSKLFTSRNLLITMTLGGLWHGASWTFVAWGVLHGLLLIVNRAFRDFCKVRPRLDGMLQTLPGTCARVGMTFLAVSLGWVLFRATTFSSATELLRRMVIPTTGLGTPLPEIGLWLTVLGVVAAHAAGRFQLWKKLAPRMPAPALGASYAMALTVVLLLNPDTGNVFLYIPF